MARVAGVEIPNNKRVAVGLTYIFGIGTSAADNILQKAEVDGNIRIKSLEEAHLNAIKKIISENYQVEGDLRTKIQLDIKRLTDINCYRGMRHRMGLPLRGQKTQTNARTRKGKRKTVSGKRKAPTKG